MTDIAKKKLGVKSGQYILLFPGGGKNARKIFKEFKAVLHDDENAVFWETDEPERVSGITRRGQSIFYYLRADDKERRATLPVHILDHVLYPGDRIVMTKDFTESIVIRKGQFAALFEEEQVVETEPFDFSKLFG